MVRRRGGGDYVPMCGVHAVRGSGHIAVPRTVAVDASADTGTQSENTLYTLCFRHTLQLVCYYCVCMCYLVTGFL